MATAGASSAGRQVRLDGMGFSSLEVRAESAARRAPDVSRSAVLDFLACSARPWEV
jgi:hypothetical protein